MKIKLIDKNSSLPNCWKECGVGKDDWDNLSSGKEIEVKSVPDSISSLVETSTKKKGDK
tara:strand:+ start:239 stop:415 length:177 start_codon:yes stop_codon:yes gene_type:complete